MGFRLGVVGSWVGRRSNAMSTSSIEKVENVLDAQLMFVLEIRSLVYGPPQFLHVAIITFNVGRNATVQQHIYLISLTTTEQEAEINSNIGVEIKTQNCLKSYSERSRCKEYASTCTSR